EARMADALHGRAGEELAERALVEPSQIRKARRAQARVGRKLRLARCFCEFVPGADGEAVVAAIDPVADRRSKFLGDWAPVLDREIGNAPPRIETIGGFEGLRRAGVEAGAAGAAMIRLPRVRLQVEIGEDRAEKEPGAEVARDEIAVLALPAEACGFGERLFHDGRRIDE